MHVKSLLERAILVLPGVIAGTAMLIVSVDSAADPHERVIMAVITGVIVEFVLAFGSLSLAYFAARVFGDGEAKAAHPSFEAIVGSMLLASVVWAMGQLNQYRNINHVAECAGRIQREERLGARDAVLECWNSRLAEEGGNEE